MMQVHSSSIVSRKRWSALVLASAVAAVALPSTVRAQTRTFVGGTDYNTVANWSPADVPNTTAENAVIDSGGAFNVTLTTSGLSVGNFTLGADDTFGLANNTGFTIVGTITNNGAFNLNSAGNNTDLFVGGASLTGGGTLTLTSASRLRGPGTFTNTSTIAGSSSGAGTVGTNELTIVNAAGGVIQANVSGTSLFVDPGTGGLSNAGTLRATGSGTLVLSGNGGGAFTNTGTIQAQAASFVRLESGASVSGGTLSTVGTGEIRTTGASVANVTLNGTLRVANNTALTVSGTIGGTGTILLDSAGNLTDLFVDSTNNATFGTGQTVTLASAARIRGTGTLTNNGTINGSNTSGAGVGINETNIVNSGVIDANVNGGALTIDPATSLTNTATLRATNGGILVLTGNGGGGFANTGGTITAQTGSTVQITNGASVTGGQVGSAGTGTVELSGNVTLTGLTLGGTVNLVNNQSAVLSGTIVNNSALTLNSAGNLTDLYVNDATVGGTGAITLKSAARIRGVGTFTNNGTINGESSSGGSVGLNETTIVNNGLINANNATGLTLVVDPAAAAAGVSTLTNNSTLRASNGGRLLLTGSGAGEFDNTAGTIDALAGSVVRIENNAVIKGGSVAAVGTGVVEAANATFTNVTFSGTVNQLNNSSVTFSGTNNGAYTLDSSGNLTDLFAGGATIGNAGVVTLKSAARIRGTGTLTNNGVLIGETGSGGSIGTNELSIVNNNLISANSPTGQTLVVDPAAAGAGTSTLTNTGSIIATAGGRLLLTGSGGGEFNNTNGIIEARNASTVRIENTATIHNGTVTSSGTGLVEVANATLDGVTVGGNVSQLNNSSVTFTGNVNLVGTYTVNSSGNLTDLYAGGATLGGTGTLVLKSASRVRGTGTFTNNGTIIGETSGGSVGTNELFMVNNGLIDANVSGASLVLDPGAGGAFTNTAIAQASGSGILVLTGSGGGTFVNTGGTVRALAGSKVQLVTNAIFSSGTLTSSGTGVVELSGGSTVSNATLGGTLNQLNNSTVTLTGTITNNGAFTVNSIGNLTDLNVGGVTLNGTGTLTLKSAARVRGTGTFTNNSTVNGETSGGSFGLNEITIVNNNLVDANASGQVLDIDPIGGTGTFTNGVAGITRASSGGILRLNGSGTGSFTNNGTFEALNGSTFTQINTAVLTNNTAGTLTGGTYRVVATNPAGTATMILPGGNITAIATATTVELSGTGSSFAQIAPIASNAGIFKLLDGRSFNTVGMYTNSGITQLGGGTFTVTGGTTNTDIGRIFGFGTLAGAISNTNLIRANGGTLQVTNAVTGSGANSELRSDSGAVLSFSGATGDPSTAKLANNGTLALGTRNVLVYGDYTNASFGTGNTFNPRAQVTGTGAINASPAVQQTLNGVTNGATATPSLDLGNVRVGTNIATPITVNNVGASGPSLRGAIQTTNAAGFGGNITDGRLGGTAMAADFGPVAPGASSMPFTIVFTGSSAGALVGQKLAVVNNFDNVAEQTLTIIGAVYNPAAASVTPNPTFVGNFHVGDVVAGSTITFANTAPAGAFSEDLGVGSVAATGTAALGVGSPTGFNVFAGGSNTAVKAAVSTATAGAKSGTITATLTSAATVNGTAIPFLTPLPLAGASVAVTGNVYRLATATVPTPVNLGDKHVGDSGVTSLTVNNTAVNDSFSESLQASAGAITGNVTAASGNATVTPGGSSTALSATISTATAGAKSGTVAVGLTSVAVGGTGLSNTALAGQTVTINANVYNLAAATVNNSQPINFGIVHVGDVVTPIGVSITNSAPAGSFSEKLNAATGPAPVGLTVAGGVSGLLAGSSSSGISVGVNTATAFVTTAAVPIAFVSDGTGLNTLGTTNLPGQNVSVSVQVNNFAKTKLSKTSGAGTFGGSGTAYTLDFGTVTRFSTNPSALLSLTNDVLGPADTLAGSWTVMATNFITSGFNPFTGLAAGTSLTNLTAALDTTNTGTFNGTITLAPRSQNGSGYNGALSSVTLTLSGTVLVPEPAVASLLLAGGALLGRRTRRGK